MEPLIAGLGEVLLGPWTMILVAALSFACLAVGLPITIIKVFKLVETVFVGASERLRTARTRARRANRDRHVSSPELLQDP